MHNMFSSVRPLLFFFLLVVLFSVFGALLLRLSVRLAPIASTFARKAPRYFSTKLIPALQNLGRRIASLGSVGIVAAPQRLPEPALPRFRPEARVPKAPAPWFRPPRLPVQPRVRVMPTTSAGR